MDITLFEERNFVRRFEAIELLETVALEGTSEVAGQGTQAAASDGRHSQASAANGGRARGQIERLITALEDVDERLFVRLRAEIAAGRHRGAAFWELLAEYCGGEGDGGRGDGWWRAGDGPGYDMLDVFANRLCSFLPMPVPTRMLEAEMVDFHKTPARVVLELARCVTAGDVFVDLGAGLGQVVLLVHLLTGARTRGLEIEPAFCGYARECAAGLGLAQALDGGPATAEDGTTCGPAAVAFLEGDARFANYAEGTVFFMYTPFRGELLATVFGLLRREASSRSFMLVTFGPCTAHAARQDWLRADEGSEREDGLGIFIATGGTCG